ncbi:MAG TPA: YidB family protein, partial [Vicinamibacterales bacterium]
MGLLDGILSNVAGSVLGGSQAHGTGPLDALVNSLGAGHQKGGADLVGAVMAMVQQNGGLPGVIDKLRGSGLGQQADSWVGTGPNAGVSPDELTQALGNTGLGNL